MSNRHYAAEDMLVASELHWLRGYFQGAGQEEIVQKIESAIAHEKLMRDRYYDLLEGVLEKQGRISARY